jgi:hypothetical protein
MFSSLIWLSTSNKSLNLLSYLIYSFTILQWNAFIYRFSILIFLNLQESSKEVWLKKVGSMINFTKFLYCINYSFKVSLDVPLNSCMIHKESESFTITLSINKLNVESFSKFLSFLYDLTTFQVMTFKKYRRERFLTSAAFNFTCCLVQVFKIS